MAATSLHISLEPEDLDYLTNEVELDRIAEVAETVRASLKLEIVTNSW